MTIEARITARNFIEGQSIIVDENHLTSAQGQMAPVLVQ